MIVIGAGRVGTALSERAQARGVPCHLITREAGWSAVDLAEGAPILVTTRNDDLEGVLARVPEPRRTDLVFVQNGMLRPWLQAHGVQEATRGLLFFAVPRKGAALEPGPHPSPFCGRHAGAVVAWLGALDVPAAAVDWARFSAVEVEKLVWNSAFGLLCEHLDADVGTICTHAVPELRSLVSELSRVARASLGVDLPLPWLVDRLCAYSRSIPTYRGAVKEWRWRNGWFVEEAERRGLATPLHLDLLRLTGHI